ncbi:hypothetical protein [Caminibacter sp.]
MAKKLIIFFLCFSFLTANAINNANGSEISTYRDYLKFKKEIEKTAVFEPARAYFILGTLYMKPFKFKEKTITPDLNKALMYFYKSLENGNKLAAYYIALLEYRRGNVYKALLVLEKTLNSIRNYKSSAYTLLSTEYASIILDTQREDKTALKKAISYIEKVDAKNKTAAYLYANLLYFLGPEYTKKASEVLNYVCSTTNDKELKKKCETNPYIKGNKAEVQCPLLKQRGE